MNQSLPSLRRRTVAKGAAWAVPVVSLSAIAPAHAASTCSPTRQLVYADPGLNDASGPP